jgi:uncharacterized surface protein with fasciclin (FAS1) repeats
MRLIAGSVEGLILILIGAFAVWLALFGNYEFLMNPRFMWLTATGGVLVSLMGLVSLISPRSRPGWSGILALSVLIAIVAIARPHGHDIHALALPVVPGFEGVPLELGDTRYEQVDLNDISRRDLEDEIDYAGRNVVLTGLLKLTPDLSAGGQFAVVRPFSICCAADALLVGVRAEGSVNPDLTDDWVNVYGTVSKVAAPMPLPRLRHGAMRYASVSKHYIVKLDSIMPYVRPRPAEDVMATLALGHYSTFVRLAEAAGLPDMLKDFDMVTVLAPVDEAFEALPPGTVDRLLSDPDTLLAFVGNHVLVGCLMESHLRDLSSAETLTGGSVPIRKVNATLRVGDSRLLFENTEARNGVIHAIYPVLWPE